MKYASKSISSKWRKTQWMLNDSRLGPYVPETRLFNRNNLKAMLDRYAKVYFKPSIGSGGNRIKRIDRPSSGGYRVRGGKSERFRSFDSLYRKLNDFARGDKFILQKGINLAETNGRPFDLRVMVQKPASGKWRTTVVFSKIGKKGKIVNNYNQGGKVAYFRETMKGAGYSDEKIKRTYDQLSRLGQNAGACFDRHSAGFRELGLDVAIDKKGRQWILETNTRPQFYPLKKLWDKKLYRRIVDYAKQYGRSK
ncbi:YheC/YheD family protein [Paenibacillaceae bacterium WGS1546]|uniref:YheC/YheD family protein n=1 Tax=Cohnella sp. WGS1546 TaxID=3366810 RepID=UPI00372D39D6